MAIQTQGHVLTNLAQFTPVNPRLAAFNPGAAMDGASEAVQLARGIEELRAYRAAQRELADTRIKRVQAQNIGYDVNINQGEKTLRQLPTLENLENLRFGQEARTIVPQTDLSLLRIAEDTKSVPVIGQSTRDQAAYSGALALGRQANLPVVMDAERADAQVKLGEADIALSTLSDRKTIAQQAAAFSVSAAPIEQKLKMAQLVDAYVNAQTDADRKRLAEEVSILARFAEANQNNASAESLRTPKGSRPGDITLEEGRILENIEKIKRTDVGGEEYHAWKKKNVNPETGKLLQPRFPQAWGRNIPIWVLDGASKNPTGRDLYEQEEQLMQELAKIRAARSPAVGTKGPVLGKDGVYRIVK